jgi:glycerol-3-phosphate acyltransferase PlsX
MIKAQLKPRPLCALGALLAKPAFKAVKDSTDPECYGGAPLLGVKGPVIICHGKSGPNAIYNAIKVCGRLVENNAAKIIEENIAALKPVFDELGAEDA